MKDKFTSLRIISATLIALGALTGCGTHQNSNTSEESSSGSSGEKTYYLAGVNQNANYAKYLSNIAIPSERDDGFKVRTNPFRVGDDNPFKFKPILTVVDDDLDPAAESNWDKPFDIKVEVKQGGSYANAEESLFEIIDNKECVIQFKSGAVGKAFKLTVAPTGVAEASLANFTQVLEVEVVDGYNVYEAKELGYIDCRSSKISEEEMALDAWTNFKVAKGMNASLKPNNLILQHDVMITLEDVPSQVLYGSSEHGANYANTMRDWCPIYRFQEDRAMTIYGNYFQLDFSKLPLITYYPSDASHVNSHSMLIDLARGDFTFADINVTGNAKYATEDGEDKYAGGLMFAKARRYANSLSCNNIIARDSFITFMGEDTETEKGYVDFLIEDSKFSNNYNSFLYNWSGKMIANRSDFVKCGGPIIIQDHTEVDSGNPHESADYTEVYGKTSYTEFNNCKLENYVAGSEAWFVQFGVTGLVGQIKEMSDLYYANGLSYIVDSRNHEPMLSTSASASNPSVFNFVAINKSGETEGATYAPVCGEVKITNDEVVEDFNYQQPTMNDLLAYAALNTFMEEQEAAVASYMSTGDPSALQALFIKWEFMPEEMTQEGITAAITAKALELKAAAQRTINHAALRGVNEAGGPVFETAGGLGYFDGVNLYMQPLDNVVPGTESTDPMTNTNSFVTGAKDYTAIYYNGMMLIMGLYQVK